MSHEEKQLLDGAMVTCYQEKGITHDNLSLTDPEHPGNTKDADSGDLHEVLMQRRMQTYGEYIKSSGEWIGIQL